MNYTEAVEYILNIPKFAKKNTLDNTANLINHLIKTQNFCKIIHVAGTNGKGSVCCFLSSILEEAGYKVGTFTSPHLITVNERIRINNEAVTDESFLRAFKKVKAVVESEDITHPTFFEWLFAMAMVIFEEEKVAYCILETGLGGRLDSTNIIQHPKVCVITSIGFDHTEVLGNTLEKIAQEKAGICKSNVPVVFDATKPRVAEVIQNKARDLHCPYIGLVEESATQDRKEAMATYRITARPDKSIDFLLDYGYDEYIDGTIAGIANYQAKNASLALLAIRYLLPDLEKRIQKSGMRKAFWPGRMEEIEQDVYIDGAHNPDGIREFIRTVKRFQGKKIVLLFSAVQEKKYNNMIEQICHEIDFHSVVVTEIKNIRAVSVSELKNQFDLYTQSPVYAVSDSKDAYKKALSEKGEDGLLFCVGSLYLVGEIQQLLRR